MSQSAEFLAGGGTLGALMRAHDWSSSPLGRPESWPHALRTTVGLLLQSRFPMFIAWGKELSFLYNDAYAEILGTKHPDALGRRFYDIWSEIWQDISPLIDAAIGGQATYREDLPLIMNRKGYAEQAWFTFSYSPVHDESGQVAGMFCAVSETTQKVLAERALRESEGRLRALVAASSYTLYRMSADWSEMLALDGPGFVADTSGPEGNWLGSYIHPDDQLQVVAEIQRAIATRDPFELEHRVRRPDGTVGWTLSRAVPLLDPYGDVAEWFGAASDVTPRRAAEEAVLELNETLERRVTEALAERKILADIVESADALVMVADLGYTLLAINRAAAEEFDRIFGVLPKVGDRLIDRLPQSQQADVIRLWSRALAGDEFTTIEEFGDPARDRRAYEIRFNTLRDRHGTPIGAYQFVYDVTERLRAQERLEKAEAALRQSQKMESLGQLTGGVAHDFNNLLAVFASGLQLLERNPHASPRVFEVMRRAVARGTGLTRHLLAFPRRLPMNPESIDVVGQLTGMRPMLDGSLGGHISVEMTFGADLWPIEVDSGEMELALLNLCLNARDAMPGGGVIAISAENVAASDAGSHDFVKLAVEDSGCGIPAEIMSRVFEPFFTTKDVSKGSGLGLPQVYGFVNQSGGRVEIESTVGTGTTVTVLLPRSLKIPTAVSGSAEAASDSPPRRDAERRGHILLVEDDKDVSVLTTELLRTLGFSVTHVISAEAALGALVNSGDIEAVLSDIMIPGGVSGLQLAREIRRGRPDLLILLTTGNLETVAEVKDGEFGVLPKPFSLETLAIALGVEVSSSSPS